MHTFLVHSFRKVPLLGCAGLCWQTVRAVCGRAAVMSSPLVHISSRRLKSLDMATNGQCALRAEKDNEFEVKVHPPCCARAPKTALQGPASIPVIWPSNLDMHQTAFLYLRQHICSVAVACGCSDTSTKQLLALCLNNNTLLGRTVVKCQTHAPNSVPQTAVG